MHLAVTRVLTSRQMVLAWAIFFIFWTVSLPQLFRALVPDKAYLRSALRYSPQLRNGHMELHSISVRFRLIFALTANPDAPIPQASSLS